MHRITDTATLLVPSRFAAPSEFCWAVPELRRTLGEELHDAVNFRQADHGIFGIYATVVAIT